MAKPIRAVTFDLWDTLVFDDSDEPKRAARGLRTKPAERRQLVWQALARHGEISLEQVSLAYDVCDAAAKRVWKRHFITWDPEQRTRVLLEGLGRPLPDAELAALVDAIARMEVDIPPEPIPGVAAGLETLVDAGYRLGIVSDAIVTPGRYLRELLERHGLRRFFRAFAFSDEVGRSKPHRAMFDHAAAELGVELSEMVHVGDRHHNDVRGPQELGMRAILFVGARDADRAITTADAVCRRYDELPGLLQALQDDQEVGS